MEKVKTIQLGRPVNPNSVRQIRLAELESRKVNGTLKLGRPVNLNSARQIRLKELAEKRDNGELRRGRPVDENSARQQKLANKAEGNGMRGRPVNPNSARQLRLSELEAKRANGEVKRGRPAGTGETKVAEVKKNLGKRYKVVLNDGDKQVNYSKSFATPKSAVKEMKELGFTNFKLIEFAIEK